MICISMSYVFKVGIFTDLKKRNSLHINQLSDCGKSESIELVVAVYFWLVIKVELSRKDVRVGMPLTD